MHKEAEKVLIGREKEQRILADAYPLTSSEN